MENEVKTYSAREVLGTAFPAERKVEYVDPSLVRIDVYYIQENKQRTQLESLEGRADVEDVATLYGPGRYYLVAKRKDNERVISQRTLDIRPEQAPEHPLSAKFLKGDEDIEDIEDDRLARLEAAIAELAERIEKPSGQSSLTERLLEKLLEEKLSTPDPLRSPEVIAAAINNAMTLQSKIMSQNLEIQGQRERAKIEFEAIERQRRWEREDRMLEAKQQLLLEQLKRMPNQHPSFDVEGDNTAALLDAFTELIGADKERQLFGGVTIGSVLGAALPQITRALEDKGIFILTTPQIEQIMKANFEKGKQVGQQEGLASLQVAKRRQEEMVDGTDEGASDTGIEDDTRPDDKVGG